MIKVLVTGASGFVGKACFDLLQNLGVEAVGTRLKPLISAEFYPVDLLRIPYDKYFRDLILDMKPTHLLHSAWDVKPGYRDSKENLEWLISSIKLVKDFFENGGQRVVTLGTCFEYDPAASIRVEYDNDISPDTLYGECKKSMCEVLSSYTQTHGYSYSHARLFYLYGINEAPNRLVPAVINSLLAGQRAKCSHGNQIRDFLYIKDVASALCTLLISDYQGVINIGSGQGITIKELVNLIADELGKLDMIDFGAIPTPANDPEVVIADTWFLNNVLEWKPKYTLKAGIQEVINSYTKAI